VRDANGIGFCEPLQPRGNVHPVAKYVTVTLDNVPRVDTNADMNLLGCSFLGVVSTKLGVNLLGALYGVDDGGEVYQKGISDRLDDHAVMSSDSLLNELVMDLQQLQGAGFVAAHLAAKADDVCKHDRGQPPNL
jgi:hypothetical protein